MVYRPLLSAHTLLLTPAVLSFHSLSVSWSWRDDREMVTRALHTVELQ